MAEASSDPLREALPPATDYYTYLTIVEYNLTRANLPILHEVLQDEKLTINIGWDLVHLLLPLLPESLSCLETIARLGNPREVILKVTEALQIAAQEEGSDDDVADSDEAEALRKDDVEAEGSGSQSATAEDDKASGILLAVLQFKTMLNMLGVLHRRIKSKRPSRFISTTLQAVLSAYSQSPATHAETKVSAILELVRTVGESRRPPLPPRQSQEAVVQTQPQNAPDPEAQDMQVTPEEAAIQNKLLQAFTTYVVEIYVLALPVDFDFGVLRWSKMVAEKLFPQNTVPDTPAGSKKAKKGRDLEGRVAVVGEALVVAQKLRLDSHQLLQAALAEDVPQSAKYEDDEPPMSADDISLSHSGALFLLVAKETGSAVSDASSSFNAFKIFPDHWNMVKKFIGVDEDGGFVTGGSAAPAVIDAIIAIGLIALAKNNIGEPDDDETFDRYLQTTSTLSANCPYADLRFQAHFLTTTILRSHPSDAVRLAFIRNTLENCPFSNLKASAVSWIKGQTVEANLGPRIQVTDGEISLFSTPVALDAVGPSLFPKLDQVLGTSDVKESWVTFQTNLSFYLATLNLYYLLLSAEHLRAPLELDALQSKYDITMSYLIPLRNASQRYRDSLQSGDLNHDLTSGAARDAQRDLMLLDDALEKVDAKLHEHFKSDQWLVR